MRSQGEPRSREGSDDLILPGAVALVLLLQQLLDRHVVPPGALPQLPRDAVAHSAAYLAAGHGALELAFDRELVAASGLRAPFEVRDLRLIDQGNMGLLHRQARGLVISE